MKKSDVGLLVFVLLLVVGVLTGVGSIAALRQRDSRVPGEEHSEQQEEQKQEPLGIGMTSNEEARLTQAEMDIMDLKKDMQNVRDVLIKLHLEEKTK